MTGRVAYKNDMVLKVHMDNQVGQVFFVVFIIKLPSIFYDIKIQIFCLFLFLPTSNFRIYTHKIAPINLFDAIVHTTHTRTLTEKNWFMQKEGRGKIVPRRRLLEMAWLFISLHKFCYWCPHTVMNEMWSDVIKHVFSHVRAFIF